MTAQEVVFFLCGLALGLSTASVIMWVGYKRNQRLDR